MIAAAAAPGGEGLDLEVAAAPTLRGRRIVLRGWRQADLAPFARLNADPLVMAHLPARLGAAESNTLVHMRIVPEFTERGFGLWALEIPGVAPFAGFVGLHVPTFAADFSPCVEIGWRLASDYWGRGYATEAARVALRFGFETIRLDEIVSFTAVMNLRSIAVMERLGMRRDGEFDHPAVPTGHPLRRHVLYRASAA